MFKIQKYYSLYFFQTRVLVTHGVQWLPKMDRIAVISNGEISEIGSYDELLTHNGAFAQFLKTFLLKEDSEDSESDDPESTPKIFKIPSEIVFNPYF